MKTILIAISLLLLTACAQTVWVKPVAPMSQLEQDKAYCRNEAARDSASYALVNPWLAIGMQDKIFKDCMRSKGYEIQK